MKVGYLIYPDVLVSNKSNGVRSQAETYAKAFNQMGGEVQFISPWENYDWKSFDLLHFFHHGWGYSLANRLRGFGVKLILSPILDPNPLELNFSRFHKRCRMYELSRGRFCYSAYWERKHFEPFTKFSVRTDFEGWYLHEKYGIATDHICKIPLSVSVQKPIVDGIKQKFCLHISSISQERKNVIRLIEAARKYNFHLVLAGNPGYGEEYQRIVNAIGNATNIEVLGFVAEEKKMQLYKAAKVFALPSLTEGVGIVALDAAAMGCEVVITNIPGPKEYYNGMCQEVNPYSVDEIGMAILNAMNNHIVHQPSLRSQDLYDKSNITFINIYLRSFYNILSFNKRH